MSHLYPQSARVASACRIDVNVELGMQMTTAKGSWRCVEDFHI